MIKLNIPLTGEEEIQEIRLVLESGNLTQGPKVKEFEDAVTQVVGSKHGFAMSSATTALHLSLVALGIKPGDEVLVSDFTYPASGNVIIQLGAKPVCVDVLLDTYAMDPQDLARKVTERTKAIMVVHPFGLSADMDPILEIARSRGLPVLEDAACALGSKYHGRFCGTMGIMGCFSFHPRKSITTGEGGMIITDDGNLANQVAALRSHGGVRREFYLEFLEAGFNYRLSDVSAALGVAQMKRLAWLIAGKREKATELASLLQNIPGIQLPVEPAGLYHTYQSFVVVLDDRFQRDHVIRQLRTMGVESTLGTYAMHCQPLYHQRYQMTPGDLPVSCRLFKQSLTLPLYPQMSGDDLRQVADSLRNTLGKC